jgi:hypothetical protein
VGVKLKRKLLQLDVIGNVCMSHGAILSSSQIVIAKCSLESAQQSTAAATRAFSVYSRLNDVKI